MDYYYFPRSHWCRVISLLIHEKGLQPRRHFVDITAKHENFEPWYIKLNPKAVVPTVVDGDTAIHNSPDIAAYLDTVAGPAHFDRASSPALARWAKVLEHFPLMYLSYMVWTNGPRAQVALSRLEDKVDRTLRYAEKYPELRDEYSRKRRFFVEFSASLRSPTKRAQVESESVGVLGALSDAVAKGPYMMGASYTLLDAIATSILYRLVDLKTLDSWNVSGTPLHGYFERLKARPSFSAVFFDDPLLPPDT